MLQTTNKLLCGPNEPDHNLSPKMSLQELRERLILLTEMWDPMILMPVSEWCANVESIPKEDSPPGCILQCALDEAYLANINGILDHSGMRPLMSHEYYMGIVDVVRCWDHKRGEEAHKAAKALPV